MKKYYAVKIGRKSGIYESWAECKKNVIGFKGAIYRGFETKEEAENFINKKLIKDDEIKEFPKYYAFVDGSYNKKKKIYGYGGFLINGNEKIVLQGVGNDPDFNGMNNVSGEILGSMAAIKKAIELELPEITIYYDYTGIELWATGEWKRNKKGTKKYHKFIKSVKDTINIKFVKVKGHTGIPGNEEADLLAKEAVGIIEEKKE